MSTEAQALNDAPTADLEQVATDLRTASEASESTAVVMLPQSDGSVLELRSAEGAEVEYIVHSEQTDMLPAYQEPVDPVDPVASINPDAPVVETTHPPEAV